MNAFLDKSITQQPKILFQDNLVKGSLFCIAISDPLTTSRMTLFKQDTNIKMNAAGGYASMDYNMFPYTNCKDR